MFTVIRHFLAKTSASIVEVLIDVAQSQHERLVKSEAFNSVFFFLQLLFFMFSGYWRSIFSTPTPASLRPHVLSRTKASNADNKQRQQQQPCRTHKKKKKRVDAPFLSPPESCYLRLWSAKDVKGPSVRRNRSTINPPRLQNKLTSIATRTRWNLEGWRPGRVSRDDSGRGFYLLMSRWGF